MDGGKRSKNFTEREKMLLIEVAKEFVSIIDNKKTDGTSIETKKQAWMALTNKYNAASETGIRTEKQLHALYDNLKKKARKNMSDDKSEIYKTGGGTFCPKTTTIDEKVVALLTPQFTPLLNEFDSSAPYYNLDGETPNNNETQVDVTKVDVTKSDIVVIINDAKDVELEAPSTSVECDKRPHTSSTATTPKLKKSSLSEIKKSNINKLSASIIKRKN